jgi:hypothetical protein
MVELCQSGNGTVVDTNGTVIDNNGTAVNGTVDTNGTVIDNGSAANGTVVVVNGTECPAQATVTVVRLLLGRNYSVSHRSIFNRQRAALQPKPLHRGEEKGRVKALGKGKQAKDLPLKLPRLPPSKPPLPKLPLIRPPPSRQQPTKRQQMRQQQKQALPERILTLRTLQQRAR